MPQSRSTNRALRCVKLFSLTGISMFIIIKAKAAHHLVKVDEEDNVVAQARDAVHHWHGNGKGKDVVHKRVERLKHHQVHNHNRSDSRDSPLHCLIH